MSLRVGLELVLRIELEFGVWSCVTQNRNILAIYEAFKSWWHYLEGSPTLVDVITDHKNLEYFSTTKLLTQRQARWSKYLSQFNLVIRFWPGWLSTNQMLLLDDGTSTLKREEVIMCQLICTILLMNSSSSPSEPHPYVIQYSELPSPWSSICSTPISNQLSHLIPLSPNISWTHLAIGQWTQMVTSDSTPGSTLRMSTILDYKFFNTSMNTWSLDILDKIGLWISSDATMSGLNSITPLSHMLNCALLVYAQSHRDIVLTDSLNNFQFLNACRTPSPWTSLRSFPDPPDLTQSSSLLTVSLSSQYSSQPLIPSPLRCLQNCLCSIYSQNTESHHMSPPTEVWSSCPHSSAH